MRARALRVCVSRQLRNSRNSEFLVRRRSLLAEFVLSSLEIVLFAGGVLCLASCQPYLLSGGEDKSICVWSPKDDWQCAELLEGHAAPVVRLLLSACVCIYIHTYKAIVCVCVCVCVCVRVCVLMHDVCGYV